MLAVQAACPSLFDRLLLRSERSEAINESREELDIISNVSYINIRGMYTSADSCLISDSNANSYTAILKASTRIKQTEIRKQGLLTKGSLSNEFLSSMQQQIQVAL